MLTNNVYGRTSIDAILNKHFTELRIIRDDEMQDIFLLRVLDSSYITCNKNVCFLSFTNIIKILGKI